MHFHNSLKFSQHLIGNELKSSFNHFNHINIVVKYVKVTIYIQCKNIKIEALQRIQQKPIYACEMCVYMCGNKLMLIH